LRNVEDTGLPICAADCGGFGVNIVINQEPGNAEAFVNSDTVAGDFHCDGEDLSTMFCDVYDGTPTFAFGPSGGTVSVGGTNPITDGFASLYLSFPGFGGAFFDIEDFDTGLNVGSSEDLVATGYTYSTTVVEPATWAMMLLGFTGLGYAGYRRARAGRATLAAY
jgi:hypothetical protein